MDYKQNIEAIEKGSIVQRQRIDSLKKDKQELIEQIKAEYAKPGINKEELNIKLLTLNSVINDEKLLYKKLAEGARNTYVTLILKIKVLGFFNLKSKERYQEFIDFINLARTKFNEITGKLSEQEQLLQNYVAQTIQNTQQTIQEFSFKYFYDIYLQQNSIMEELTKTALSFESRKNKLKDELISKVAHINILYGDDIDAFNSNKEIAELLAQIKKDFMVILSATYTMLLFKEIESINEYLERIYNSAKPEVRALLDTNNKNSPLNAV